MSRSQTYLGHLDRARAFRDKALARARQLMHDHTLITVESISFEIDDDIGLDPKILRNRANEVGAHADQFGFPYWSAAAFMNHGTSLLCLGQAEEALKLLIEGLTKFKATGAITTVPQALTTTAEALCRIGRSTEALQHLDEALRQIESTNERHHESKVHRVYGECLISSDDPTSAENCFNRALDVARRQSAKLWEIRAATSLAQLWRDQGKRLDALNLLGPIYGWFTEGFDTPVLQDAKALLDELT